MRTAVALGSNLGDRLANLRAARTAIVDLPGVTPPMVSSPVYETEPVGMEPAAEDVLNAIVEFEYGGDAEELLEQLLRIEQSLGRDRTQASKVSRKIDIDLLYCGGREMNNERLQLPHPRMHLRKFVLQPLNDIQPELVLPNQTRSVRELLAEVADPAKVVPVSKDW